MTIKPLSDKVVCFPFCYRWIAKGKIITPPCQVTVYFITNPANIYPAFFIPPLQGWFLLIYTQGCASLALGFHISGFQPVFTQSCLSIKH
jgi:hypothetical protein